MSLSVSQVAMKLGFDYPQHFNRFFKRHTGKTPKGFRLSAAG
jgi:AraC-like DNA-binding protein